MTTAEIQAALTAIDRAIASGTTEVRTPDGGFVRYDSFARLIARRDWLRERLAEAEGKPATAPRRIVVRSRKAL